MLHGRELERGRLSRLLQDARAGRAGALAVVGEPGVGKSVLLDDLGAAGTGFRVLRTQGLESEAPLAFAALHRLLRPVHDLFERLPSPQAHALRVAFGLDSGPSVEPFLVSVAALSTLVEAAATAPLLCIVDDAHWLDTASRDALLFAARRLTDERVAVVLSARASEGAGLDAPGLDRLVLNGLDAAAATAVLAEHGVTPLSASVVTTLLERTGGNPLALVELPATLTADQLAGTQPLPDRLPLTQVVERCFLDRVRRLSEAGQTVLLVAAADDSSRLRVVRDAAASLGAGAAAVAEAERARLIMTDADTVRVAHPLVRSATYSAATGGERRAAHRALAAALGAVGDADRRAWHLAASVDGPDTEAADALVGVAVRAERRGGYGAAAAAYDRAASLSTDREDRGRLLFDAARNRWLIGQAEAASSALAAAREHTEGRVLRADIDRLRARLEVNVGSAAAAHQIFLAASRAVAADDPERALEMAVAAALLRVYDAELADDPSSVPVSPPTARAPGDTARATTLRRMLEALDNAADGRIADAITGLEAAVQSSRSVAAPDRAEDRLLWTTCAASEPDVVANLGNTATHLGHDLVAHDCYTRLLAEGRRTGAVTVVLYALPRLAFTQLLLGQWDALRHGAHEAVDLATSIGQTSIGQTSMAAGPLAWLALLAALQGDPAYEEHHGRAAAAGEQHLGVFMGLSCDLQRWARAATAANVGDHAGALHDYAAMRVPAFRRATAVERITAAARAGDRAQAQADLDEHAAYAAASQLAWALATVEHARAVLAPAELAGAHLHRALVHHQRSSRSVDQAHTHLAYGEHLRRAQRRTDARSHLRAALATFEELRAEPLAARARTELRASGETPRRRDPSTLVALTPMEQQVARLVVQGLSNKDVAAQLWISPRTVAFHLRNVFAKLEVSSRGELSQLSV